VKIVTEIPTDWRVSLPRYSAEALKKNAELAAKVAKMGEDKGCSAAHLSIA
jgi:aryl-alcohol dehydrogenase-like predicted oxidoreductase